jgi:hypothetical protein
VDAGAGFDFALRDGEQGFAVVIHGSGDAGELPLSAGCALGLAPGGSSTIIAGEPLRLACFSGRPLCEPIVRHGPFVMSDEGQVVAALQRFQSQLALRDLQPGQHHVHIAHGAVACQGLQAVALQQGVQPMAFVLRIQLARQAHGAQGFDLERMA